MGMVDVREVESEHPDALALVASYFDELRTRLADFAPPSREELRADAARGAVLVAYDGGRPVGTGALRRLDATTAEVKRMFVAPEARGAGHARRILGALEEQALGLGCTRIVLDTAAPLEEAARLYVREGYRPIQRYNDNPHAAYWFEKALGGAAT
jgi:GNAT superfamily N-acetyltransferase